MMDDSKDYSGMLIVMEGPDGAGKTTLSQNIIEKLKERHNGRVQWTCEPGGTPYSQHIRTLLKDKSLRDYEPVSADVEKLLFAASRLQNIEALIVPTLKASDVIMLDRNHMTTMCYQHAYGPDEKMLADEAMLIEMAGIVADITVIVLRNPEASRETIDQRGTDSNDSFERGMEFTRRCYRRYKYIADHPEKFKHLFGEIVVINADVFDSEEHVESIKLAEHRIYETYNRKIQGTGIAFCDAAFVDTGIVITPVRHTNNVKVPVYVPMENAGSATVTECLKHIKSQLPMNYFWSTTNAK